MDTPEELARMQAGLDGIESDDPFERRYEETMAKLADPDGWDIEGVMDDIREDCVALSFGEGAAVIDYLSEKLGETRGLVQMLSHDLMAARKELEAIREVEVVG